MMGKVLKGGKTTPRLLLDLYLYDPSKPPPSGFNVLTDLPTYDDEQKDQLPPPPLVGKGSCRHQWSLKRNQCDLPGTEAYAQGPAAGTLAAYCSICRSHIELKLQYPSGTNYGEQCPGNDRLLHHFVHQPDRSKPRQPEDSLIQIQDDDALVDTNHFRCSSWTCGAELTVQYKPPRLSQSWVDLLNDNAIIKARAERAIAADPARFEGFAIPLRVDVLMHSKHYITNPLFNPEKSKKIQGHNKRFLLSMGEPCADILEYFGFMREGLDWMPPVLEPATKLPYSNELNIRIDDIEKELFVLISRASEEEKRKATYEWVPEMAIHEMKSLLGCTEYPKNTRSPSVDLARNTQAHPYYAGLGAVMDFHDDLLIYAYERQVESDHDNESYYLECLQGIQVGRESEGLQIKVDVEAANEKISSRDVRKAHRDLGLDVKARHDDDTIIGVFNSRIADAPKQEDEMRRALKVIGLSRSSQKIQVTASQAITNYEQALSFLDVEHQTSDEFIHAAFTLKVSEKPSDENNLRRAVEMIANHRNSQALKHFVETGEMGETEMDVDTAYARFDISERMVDDELVLTTYNLRVSDDPSQLDSLRTALAAIARDRHSRRINDFLNSGIISSQHSLSEWPVGLENIGNTCYLNSLLQFYFTIKPLRDLVLNIDDFKTLLDGETPFSKRVGSRNVSKKEVQRAQKFIDELRKLFQNMITAPTGSVTPEPELARLTLVSSERAELIRRQSLLSPTRPSLGEIHGEPVLGPLGPPQTEPMEDTEMRDNTVSQDSGLATTNRNVEGTIDSSSDVTLVDGPVVSASDNTIIDSDNKSHPGSTLENKVDYPTSTEGRKTSPLKNGSSHTEEMSSSRMNQQIDSPGVTGTAHGDATTTSTNHEMEIDTAATDLFSEATAIVAPPKRSPPLPPRPTQIQTGASNALQEAEYGAQQDVTEVIANCLFQLQCAIKAEAVDNTGEQIDRVKHLFFGKQKSYTTDKHGKTRTKEEYMSDIKVDVASGPRDIYAALDGAYDVQEVEVGGGFEPQYTSISQLPPILQVHVQRSLYDRERKAAFKSINHLELKETIYMDRYMDTDDTDLLDRRQQCWQWKRQLLVLEERRAQLLHSEKGQNTIEVLEATSGFLHQLSSVKDDDPIEISPGMIEEVEKATEEARKELQSLEIQVRDLQSNISSQFNDLREIPYRLQSVFIHRGYHNAGHYWIYIYDFSQDIWRKYNDGYVTEVRDTSEIFVQEPGERPATPYFLVYVKEDQKHVLVNSVSREPCEPVQDVQDDIVMKDQTQAVELPAPVPSSFTATSAPQEYGVTENYDNPTWSRTDTWNSTTAEAPIRW